VHEAAEGVGDAQRGRHLPDVVIEEDRRLPEAAIALGVGGEVVGEGFEVLAGKLRVGVAAGHGKVIQVAALFAYQVLDGASCCPVFVGGLTPDLSRKADRVDGDEDVAEIGGKLLLECLSLAAAVGFCCFHGQDQDDAATCPIGTGERG
jgi:hypothetical protein